MKPAATLTDIAARLRFLLHLAGWPGVVGLALLLLGGIVQFVLIPQQRQFTEVAHAAAEQQHQAYLRSAEDARRGVPDAAESLVRFRSLLTPEAQADEALEIIQRDAKANGLSPAGTEYKWQQQPAAKLAEVQITLPVKGAYAPLRGFVQNVLADVPGLALDQFDLQRDSIAAAVSDSHLHFTLFLKAGS